MANTTPQDISQNVAYGAIGLDMDSIISQVPKGKLTYCLNGTVEALTNSAQVSYQNETGNSKCIDFGDYQVIGTKVIVELDMILYFLTNGDNSKISSSRLSGCTLTDILSSPCLNFEANHPIKKVEYEINGNAKRIYFCDDYNPDRYIDLNNLPYKIIKNADNECDIQYSTEIDCNRIKIRSDFNIPYLTVKYVNSGGQLIEGTYQFGVQYSDSVATPYTEVYNITDPVPIFKDGITQDFNLPTDKSITVLINNLDTTVYQYFNLVVVKTVNGTSSYEIAGTYPTSSKQKSIIYTGSKVLTITADDIFQEFPFYERSRGVSQSDGILIWNGVTKAKRTNYQQIASNIKLNWVTYRLPPTSGYDDPEIAANYRGYMGDEVYAFEFQPILANGKKCDGFHIPGRIASSYDRDIVDNPLISNELCNEEESATERWRVFNTSTVTGSLFTEGEDYDVEKANALLAEIKSTQSTLDELQVQLNDLYDGIPDKIQDIESYLEQSSSGINGYHSIGADIGSQAYSEIIGWATQIPTDIESIKNALARFKGQHGTGSLTNRIISTAESISTDRANVEGLNDEIKDATDKITSLYSDYNNLVKGTSACSPTPFEYGEFGYYESKENYPCNEEIWGDLAGKPIRHHRFPKSKHTDSVGNTYVHGLRVDVTSIVSAIKESGLSQDERDQIVGFKILRADRVGNKSVIAKGLINNVGIYNRDNEIYFYPNYPFNDVREDPFISLTQTRDDTGANHSLALDGFSTIESRKRFTFHSPDTHFYQPSIGDYIEIEGIAHGTARGHFVPVKEHPKYQIPSRSAIAVVVAVTLGLVAAGSKEGTSLFGVGDILGGAETPWQESLTVFLQAMDIMTKSIPHKNVAYQFNSVGEYTAFQEMPEGVQTIYPLSGNSRYISDGLANVEDIYKLNNFLRESSVYLKTEGIIPFTHDLFPELEDTSRYTASSNHCKTTINTSTISSYYVALKRNLLSQYGQMYSYETIDTGSYFDLKNNPDSVYIDIFGGDTFVSRFAYKNKHSFFTQNLVGRQDGLGLDFRNYGNVGYPTYWLSNERDGNFNWEDATQAATGILAGAAAGGLGSMSITGAIRGAAAGAILGGIGVLTDNNQNNFDCKGDKFFYQDGKFYLFSYGIPYFYVESEVNCNLRQAYNTKEGDFYPHVSQGSPDDWLQEINVPIVNDNTYWYNTTFSKQNRESFFSHLPEDYNPDEPVTFINRAVYSERQASQSNYKINNWLIYRPLSFYDFPQTNGKLISLDRIENRAILARFENKSELYNAMLRIDTSNPQAAYIGNSTLFTSAPPIDFSDTDTGYVGTQHTTFLKTPFGNISIDAERGGVFIFEGQKAKDISGSISKFLARNLPFQIKEYFPTIEIDNAYNGIGITAVFDSVLNRVIITKLDYKPLMNDIIYINNTFVYNNKQVSLTDPKYFQNCSFTISYHFPTQSWVSFHSYLPNYYIGTPYQFYSGIPGSSWAHDNNTTILNNFYGVIEPYIIEYLFSYKIKDEIVQSVKDYSTVVKYNSNEENDYIEVHDRYFDEAILYSKSQCSGTLRLTNKPMGDMRAALQYPKYNPDSIEILYTKSDNLYQYNTFWSLVQDKSKPLFIPGPNLSQPKVLNSENMEYAKTSYKKQSIKSHDLKIRHTLNSTSDYRLISHFVLSQTQKSYK